MAQFKNMYKVELNNGIAPVVSLKQIYYADVEANRIGAIVTMNGQPFPLSGTCTGSAILADGSTVPMAGVIDGNQAYIDLDSSCYSVEGQIKIFVKITTGGVTTTLLAAVGTVQLTETDAVIDPGTIIPSVSALITAIEDAVESIPADYTALLATIAPTFDNTAAYAIGAHVWYSGTLYRFTAPHAAGAWIGTDAVVVVIGTELEAKAEKAMLAPTEASSTASAAHVPGTPSEYFIYGGVLYQATENIAQGGSIVTSGAGKNCEAVTVGGEISDINSFTIPGITKKLYLQKSANVFDKKKAVIGNIDSTGEIITGSYVCSDYIPVSAADVVYFCYDNTISVPALNFFKVAGYDSGKGFVSGSFTDTRASSYTVPSGCHYIRFAIAADMLDVAMAIINDSVRPSAYIAYDQYYIAAYDFIKPVLDAQNYLKGTVEKTNTDFWERDRSLNLFDKNDFVYDEYFVSDGTTAADSSMFRSYVELDGAGTYCLQVNGLFYGMTLAFRIPCFDKNRNYVKTIYATTEDTTASNNNECLLTISNQDIADGVYYIGYSQKKDYKDSEMIVKSSTYPTTYIPYYSDWNLPDLNYDTNPLKNKIAVFDGDSICAGTGSNTEVYGKGWAGRIRVYNDMTCYNVGVSGATITAETYFDGELARHWICTNIETIHTQYPDLDYLILEGGTNDADILGADPAKIGEFDEADFTGPFDVTTFYGAMDSLCKKALTYYPKAKIGFIVAQKMGLGFAGAVKRRYDYFGYAEKVCKKWGIPVLNLWDAGQLRPDVESNYNPTYNTIETATEHGYLYWDGQHLTAYGYDVISPKISEWMKTL